MSHTPEPWFLEGDSAFSDPDCTEKIAHFLTCQYDEDFNHADARRLVACVNACAGLDTALLENITMLGDTLKGRFEALNAENRNLSALNAELLAALCEALPFVEDHEGSEVYKSGAVKATLTVLRDAIAKAEETKS